LEECVFDNGWRFWPPIYVEPLVEFEGDGWVLAGYQIGFEEEDASERGAISSSDFICRDPEDLARLKGGTTPSRDHEPSRYVGGKEDGSISISFLGLLGWSMAAFERSAREHVDDLRYIFLAGTSSRGERVKNCGIK